MNVYVSVTKVSLKFAGYGCGFYFRGMDFVRSTELDTVRINEYIFKFIFENY